MGNKDWIQRKQAAIPTPTAVRFHTARPENLVSAYRRLLNKRESLREALGEARDLARQNNSGEMAQLDNLARQLEVTERQTRAFAANTHTYNERGSAAISRVAATHRAARDLSEAQTEAAAAANMVAVTKRQLPELARTSRRLEAEAVAAKAAERRASPAERAGKAREAAAAQRSARSARLAHANAMTDANAMHEQAKERVVAARAAHGEALSGARARGAFHSPEHYADLRQRHPELRSENVQRLELRQTIARRAYESAERPRSPTYGATGSRVIPRAAR